MLPGRRLSLLLEGCRYILHRPALAVLGHQLALVPEVRADATVSTMNLYVARIRARVQRFPKRTVRVVGAGGNATGLALFRMGLASVQSEPALVHSLCPVLRARDPARNLVLHPLLTLNAAFLCRGEPVTRTGADCPTLMT